MAHGHQARLLLIRTSRVHTRAKPEARAKAGCNPCAPSAVRCACCAGDGQLTSQEMLDASRECRNMDDLIQGSGTPEQQGGLLLITGCSLSAWAWAGTEEQ